MKTFTVGDRTFHLGRNRPKVRYPRLELVNYLKTSLPPAPDSDYTARASRSLACMYLNDRLGDCVIACGGHAFGVLNENVGGNPSIFTDPEIIYNYEKIGDYDPSQTQPDGSNPTDNGCDEVTALNWWLEHGMNGHHYSGWLAVDATSVEQVRTAAWLFENLIFGVELPDSWVDPFPSASGFTWDVAGPSIPANGHCFLGCGANSIGVPISTWAMVGTVTYAAIAQYAVNQSGGELYTVVSKESLARATQKAPNGFDWSQLVADFDSMGGHV